MGRPRERRLSEVQAGSEGLQSMSGAYSARDVLINTIDTVAEKQCWLQVHMIDTIIQNSITSQMRLTYTQHSCTQMLTKTCLQSRQNLTNGMMHDEVWKLNTTFYGYRKAPKLWHQHVVSILESLSYHHLLTDPSCFRKKELNINIFIHVDDGLLFARELKF